MKGVALFCSLCILMVSCFESSTTRLVEKVAKRGDQIAIPYEKYVLENGLTLLIHEDHSDPLVHVDVTYHVGSAREELHKSGFAHFFEHMMFQGSENVADEEHFKIVTESGGTLNGTTNRDRTNYYQTIPSNQLERVLWLEADRMGFLLGAVTQKKFEVQRATVKNEKGQRYDNAPYGRFSELKDGALYPYGHPYSWLTIGRLEDLDRVDVNDLKRFFLRWYGPNNATLSIGGDVSPKKVIRLVEKYFGTIARGPEVKSMHLDQITLDKNRYVSYVDKNIRFPAIVLSYPTVPRFHPDEAPLDCLAEILGQSKSSYFYQKFVKTNKAIQAAASNVASELAGEFFMFVLPFPGQNLSDFEQSITKIFEEFAENGVTEGDIEKFKARYESRVIRGLESVSGKVSQLADFQTFLSDPNGIKHDLDRYRDITKKDVMRVFDKYIRKKPHVIVSILDNPKTKPAKPDNYQIPTSGDNPFPTTNYQGLTYTRPTGDNFDRSKKPAAGPNPVVKVPRFWESKFDNGMKVIGSQSDEVPTVFLQLTINGGHKLDGAKNGLAALTAGLLNESTKNYTPEQIQEELRKLGSNISVNGSRSSITLSVFSLKKNIKKTLQLAEEVLMRPAFKQEDFVRLKQQQLEDVLGQRKNPRIVADLVYDKLLFGAKHLYGMPTYGDESSVASINLKDVKAFYKTYFSPSVSELVVVGAVSEQDIMPQLQFLKDWNPKTISIPSVASKKQRKKTTLYLVNKPNAPQSEIRIGYVTDLTYDVAGDYYKSYLMNFPLGDAFNSRINLNLREDKGWTYGARANFSADDEIGYYTALAGVKAAATDSSVIEFIKEITDYNKDGISDEELDFMRNSIGQRDARKYETPSQKARFLQRIVHYNLDKSFVDQQTSVVKDISKEELNALAKKYLKPEKMLILVVGDAKKLKTKLKKLGYGVVMLDVNGNRV